MDDILDLMEDAAQTISLYDLQGDHAGGEAPGRAVPGLLRKGAGGRRPAAQHGQRAARSSPICEEIDRLESDADHVMRAAMSKLFRDEPDVRNLIKLKAIYEILETVTDRCEDVANIIEGIIVENA